MTLESVKDEAVVVPYDLLWPEIYQEESKAVLSVCGKDILEIEHIGSTAVPNLTAKPIIDMMVAVENIDSTIKLLNFLNGLGYQIVETGMRERIFLRKQVSVFSIPFHLHIVEMSSWENRKERVMRDYLQANSNDAIEYGELKVKLATKYCGDTLAYTKGKTEFIQNLMDKACDEMGMARIDVWND